jgi:hypothetical protein
MLRTLKRLEYIRKRMTPDLIPTEIRTVLTKLPVPIASILSLAKIPLHGLSRADFTPEFSGKRFVIKRGVRNFTVFDGRFIRVDEDPGIPGQCEGYSEIVASIENCWRLKEHRNPSSVANAWDDEFIYLDMDKLFGGKEYRCFAV